MSQTQYHITVKSQDSAPDVRPTLSENGIIPLTLDHMFIAAGEYVKIDAITYYPKQQILIVDLWFVCSNLKEQTDFTNKLIAEGWK